MDSDELERQEAEWQAKLQRVPLLKPNHAKWSKNIRSISVDELGIFGLDENGVFYWDGEPVELKRTIELRTYERVIATIVAIAAVISVSVGAWEWACDLGALGQPWCPVPAISLQGPA